MYSYAPGVEMDLMVANLWTRMRDAGDLPRVFTPGAEGLGTLYRMVSPPNGMLFESDGTGVWLAMWMEQLLFTMFTGLWIAPDRRHSRETVRCLIRMYDTMLRVSPTIMGVTCQEELLKGHIRLGYHVLGHVPGMWDGETGAWVVLLSREGWAIARERLARLARLEEAADGRGASREGRQGQAV